MTIAKFSFTIAKSPEALERVLRIIRQRNFRVVAMQVEPVGIEQDPTKFIAYNVTISLYGLVKEINYLLPQLEKVYLLSNLKLENY